MPHSLAVAKDQKEQNFQNMLRYSMSSSTAYCKNFTNDAVNKHTDK